MLRMCQAGEPAPADSEPRARVPSSPGRLPRKARWIRAMRNPSQEEGVLAGFGPKRDRDVPTSCDPELCAKGVAVGFCCSRRDTEPSRDFVVGAPFRKETDDLLLPLCEPHRAAPPTARSSQAGEGL